MPTALKAAAKRTHEEMNGFEGEASVQDDSLADPVFGAGEVDEETTSTIDEGKDKEPSSARPPLVGSYLPQLRYTSFPPAPASLPSRPAASKYLRGDRSYFLAASGYRPDEAVESLAPPEPGRIVVIHPGSRTLRIGLASDTLPHSMPHVIARHLTQHGEDMQMDDTVEGGGVGYEGAIPVARNVLAMRQAMSHRRPNKQAHALVRSYNASASPEMIPELNDPYRVEWTVVEGFGDVPVGTRALSLPESPGTGWERRWPWRGGGLNVGGEEGSYTSVAACIGDLAVLWGRALEELLGIGPKEVGDYHVTLVIPERMHRPHLGRVVDVLLGDLGFAGIILCVEGVAATFGAGTSTACVLDVGAASTTVACVEEGLTLPGSSFTLPYGGDDVTRVMAAVLADASVSARVGLGLRRPWEWGVVEGLKETLGTLREGEVAMQVASATARGPGGGGAAKWHLKLCDEVMLAPLLPFVPEMLQVVHEVRAQRRGLGSGDGADNGRGEGEGDGEGSGGEEEEETGGDEVEEEVGADVSTPVGEGKATGRRKGRVGGKNGKRKGARKTSTPTMAKEEEDNEEEEKEVEEEEEEEGEEGEVEDIPIKVDDVDEEGDTSVGEIQVTEEVKEDGGGDEDEGIRLPEWGWTVEEAIGRSIGAVGPERAKRFYGSILCVGGGTLAPGFGDLLEERLGVSPRFAAACAALEAASATVVASPTIRVLSSSRDMDPRVIVWKGGSVLGRLESTAETWCYRGEWLESRERCLVERSMFLW